MALFKPAEVTSAYLKMGLLGFAGSGKTKTASLTAIGLVLHARKLGNIDYADKPVFFIDTETGSDWVKPDFDAMGVPLMVAKTRAFVDLLQAVEEAQKDGSFLLIDSVTHFWKELCDSYVRERSKGRSATYRLQFQDWAYLKGEWGKFTDAFINSPLHIALCGRAGFEYDYFEDEDGKKQLEKTGVKMKAEGEMGYEPSLLVHMERGQKVEGGSVTSVWREATILKDRSTLLDGKCFAFEDKGNTEANARQTFGTFLPHIKRLNLGGKQLGVDTTRTSAHAIQPEKKDWSSTQRQIVLEEIEAVLIEHYPSTSKEDKLAKAALILKHFETRSWTEVTNMRVEELKLRYDSLYRDLKDGAPSRYGSAIARDNASTDINDEIPDFDRAATTTAPTGEMSIEDKLISQIGELATVNDVMHLAGAIAQLELSEESRGRINTALMARQTAIAKAQAPASEQQQEENENTDGKDDTVASEPNDGSRARTRRKPAPSVLAAG